MSSYEKISHFILTGRLPSIDCHPPLSEVYDRVVFPPMEDPMEEPLEKMAAIAEND